MGTEVSFGEVRKNRAQIIRVILDEWRGNPTVGLHTWAVADDGSQTFTGKTFGLAVGIWAELLPLIEAAAEEGIRRMAASRGHR